MVANKLICSIAFLLALPVVVLGQDNPGGFFADVGWVARKTIFYRSGVKKYQRGPTINTNAPFSYRGGVHGTGINAHLGYRFPGKAPLLFAWGSTIRYDEFYIYGGDANTIYIDQSISIKKYIHKRAYVGVGATIFNFGKEEIKYTRLPSYTWQETLTLQFSSLDLMFGVRFGKIFAEPKISIVQDNFPGDLKDNATLLGIRLYYQFGFKRAARHTGTGISPDRKKGEA